MVMSGMTRLRHVSRAAALLLCTGLLTGATAQQANAGEALRPNLVADPPEFQKLEPSSKEGENELLLRFTGYVHNKGPGAVDFRGRRNPPNVTASEAEIIKMEKEG